METQINTVLPDQTQTLELARALDCHPILASLLVSRGITSPDEAKTFLHPSFEGLANPFDMAGMEEACARIHTAVVNHEKILIFGDFDADGVTATALLQEFLSSVEANVTWYVPHRLKEGYSFQETHARMAVKEDVDLIITVDCGITSNSAVTLANEEDIDVIVTDHHEPGATLPEALAVIDPKRGDDASGLDFLAGVGVAFFLVMALRKCFRERGIWERYEEPSLLRFLDLFAIGTIGDLVPLVRENRVLCMTGIRQLQKGARPGIQSLAHSARVDLRQLDSDDISFKLVPRINAAGRMSHARICVSHLTASQMAEAATTADLLDQLNLKRQQVEREILFCIERRIAGNPALLTPKVLVIWDRDWDPAVLGIVASRLSRQYARPAVLLRAGKELAKGSCRSINQINIHEALTALSPLLVQFGGHAMAAGLTVKTCDLEAFRQRLEQYMEEKFSSKDFQRQVCVDAELSLTDITPDLVRQINALRPFGTDNPEPLFLCRNVKVASSLIIGNNHRKMTLTDDRNPGVGVEAIHFNLKDTTDLPVQFRQLLFRLKINKFKGETPQLVIEDL